MNKHEDIFINHPDGGHCNLMGMTDGCYGCGRYGTGDTEGCEKRVNEMKEAICTNFMLPRDFLFNDNENASIDDPRWNTFVKNMRKLMESLKPDCNKRPLKIKKGHYIYKGFLIYSIGYYNPEHRVCWEAVDTGGNGCAHGFSKKECMMWIDELLKRENQNDR